jgi:hypothetical protein
MVMVNLLKENYARIIQGMIVKIRTVNWADKLTQFLLKGLLSNECTYLWQCLLLCKDDFRWRTRVCEQLKLSITFV